VTQWPAPAQNGFLIQGILCCFPEGGGSGYVSTRRVHFTMWRRAFHGRWLELSIVSPAIHCNCL